MNLKEYKNIKKMNYLEYCDYLQNKYGIPDVDYMTENFHKNTRVTRTRDGLFAHHKYENVIPMLSTESVAKLFPHDFQKKENIVYCDYLEHLYLHILIYENPSDITSDLFVVGIGGILNFLIPELNDIYSGFVSEQSWKNICISKVINDKDVYLLLVKRFIKDWKKDRNLKYNKKELYSSFNEKYGLWKKENNKELCKSFFEDK